MAKPIFGAPGIASPSHHLCLSDLGKKILAGLLSALLSIMPLLAPTVSSYKRLIENHWARIHLSLGYGNKLASLRIIGAPLHSPTATRLEVRVPEADLHPHYAMTQSSVTVCKELCRS